MPKTIPMIASRHIRTATTQADWQRQLAQAVTDTTSLLDQLNLQPGDIDGYSENDAGFPLRVPQAYIDKMVAGDAADPLLHQVLNRRYELDDVRGYHKDPVGDLDACQVPGLLHKYHGRVLLITTAACAVHCRYCFRRHFPYQQQQASYNDTSAALTYIRQHEDIHEVILSGGDPLVLSDQRLSQLIQQLQGIPHLKHLRIHTRLPVVLPDRITAGLVQALSSHRFQLTVVIHANHANEITQPEKAALRRLQSAGIILLNQAVLLNNVNTGLQQQIALSETLYSAGVLPYYLHLLDPVAGAAHYDVPLEQAEILIHQMRQRLPGFLVPRLVREIAGEKSKTPANEL